MSRHPTVYPGSKRHDGHPVEADWIVRSLVDRTREMVVSRHGRPIEILKDIQSVDRTSCWYRYLDTVLVNCDFYIDLEPKSQNFMTSFPRFWYVRTKLKHESVVDLDCQTTESVRTISCDQSDDDDGGEERTFTTSPLRVWSGVVVLRIYQKLCSYVLLLSSHVCVFATSVVISFVLTTTTERRGSSFLITSTGAVHPVWSSKRPGGSSMYRFTGS